MSTFSLNTQWSSPNVGERRPPHHHVSLLVLHYTEIDLQETLDKFKDPKTEVSAHYVVSEEGEIFLMVDETRRAWHAGASYWRGIEDVNSASVGIEIVNPGDRPYTEPQMVSVMALSQDIVTRHDILPWNIVGHSDVAPSRKIDPGKFFPWARLAQNGLGLWPDEESCAQYAPLAIDKVPDALVGIGYSPTSVQDNLKGILSAFQLHFQPDFITGEVNPETLRRLSWLLHRIPRA